MFKPQIVDDLDVARPMIEMGARKLKPCRSPSDRWERVNGAIQVVRRSGPAPLSLIEVKASGVQSVPIHSVITYVKVYRKHREDSIVFGSALSLGRITMC